MGAEVKLLLIGGFVGLAIGVGLNVLYFSLATFFAVNARVLDARGKGREWQRDRRTLNRQDEGWMSWRKEICDKS
jgi:hypothetical protein